MTDPGHNASRADKISNTRSRPSADRPTARNANVTSCRHEGARLRPASDPTSAPLRPASEPGTSRGASRAATTPTVLEDQITIARRGPNPYDKPANPAPCSHQTP
jgi:hypothetical protein